MTKENKEVTDEQADILQDLYYGHFASSNHDESGCENWIESMDYDEAEATIKRIQAQDKKNEEKEKHDHEMWEKGRAFGQAEVRTEKEVVIPIAKDTEYFTVELFAGKFTVESSFWFGDKIDMGRYSNNLYFTSK